MIVKVQISQNDSGSTVLIYNQSRSFLQQFATTPKIKKLMGDSPKRYFEATVIEDELHLGESVPPQPW